MDDVIQLAGVMGTLLATVLGGWAGYIALRKWEKGSHGASPRELAALNDRLAHLEQSMDALAFEMERMGESQRFTARLLTERAIAAGEPVPEALPAELRQAPPAARVAESRQAR